MNALERAIYSRLSGDAGLAALVDDRIYNIAAPRGASLPYVVFNQQSGREENRTPRRERLYDYTIKAIAQTLQEAGDIADAIDTAMFDATLHVDGWNEAYWVRPVTTIRYKEIEASGDAVYHAGAVYEIRIAQ